MRAWFTPDFFRLYKSNIDKNLQFIYWFCIKCDQFENLRRKKVLYNSVEFLTFLFNLQVHEKNKPDNLRFMQEKLAFSATKG